jgi:hypothetical protein
MGSYPNNTFDYEYPQSSLYYPGNDCVSNVVVPVNSVNDEVVNVSRSGKIDVTKSSSLVSLAADAGNNGGVIRERLMSGVGEQDLLSHLNVSHNRYTAEKPVGEIYIPPINRDLVPYTSSLYETPYDTTQNLISTGILYNTYTGESYETFENQLPPPNTIKGQIPDYQLQQINPRLLHLNGGYNHHNPPPRKQELLSESFNPVDIKGGSNPWGSQLYTAQIRDEMQKMVSRDIYNNRDGDYAVEPSMNGDKPQGYIGLVPRNQYRPYIPPTQEINMEGRMQTAENLNPDLTKREQYTGEVFSRKAHVLVTNRAVIPNQLINGVEAVAQIPIATEHSNTERSVLVQAYITPAFIDGATHMHNTFLGDRVGHINAGQMNPLGPVDYSNTQPTAVVIDREVHGRTASAQTFRLAGNPQNQHTGNMTTSQASVLPTMDVYTHPTLLPNVVSNQSNTMTSQASVLPTMDVYTHPTLLPNVVSNQSNTMTNLYTVRDTLKGTIDGSAYGGGIHSITDGGIVTMEHQQVRPTLLLQEALPLGGVTPVARGDIIVNQHSILETLKELDLNRINTVQESNAFGRVIVSTASVKNTLTGHGESLPTGGITELPQTYVQLDKTVIDTQRRTMPSWNYTQVVNGETLGDNVGPGQVVIQQIRGVDEEQYVTQNEKIVDSIGGSSTRVIGEYELRDDRVTINYGNSDVVNQPRIDRFIPMIRPTLRAYHEMEEDCEVEKLDM